MAFNHRLKRMCAARIGTIGKSHGCGEPKRVRIHLPARRPMRAGRDAKYGLKALIRLPHLVGPAKAIEICTTGKRYLAEVTLRPFTSFTGREPDPLRMQASFLRLLAARRD